ncbi:unnamed protein product [Brassica oleracea var. botrytis]
MLERDPKQRLTAQQVLSKKCTRYTPLDATVLSRLKKFSETDKLKKIALQVIVERLSEEKIHSLRETFKTIDSEQSRRVTYKELKSILESFDTNLDNSDISGLMQTPMNEHLKDTVARSS